VPTRRVPAKVPSVLPSLRTAVGSDGSPLPRTVFPTLVTSSRLPFTENCWARRISAVRSVSLWEIDRLGDLTATQISSLSHLDTPWVAAKEREVLEYEHVFYRPEETSVREYEPL